SISLFGTMAVPPAMIGNGGWCSAGAKVPTTCVVIRTRFETRYGEPLPAIACSESVQPAKNGSLGIKVAAVAAPWLSVTPQKPGETNENQENWSVMSSVTPSDGITVDCSIRSSS